MRWLSIALLAASATSFQPSVAVAQPEAEQVPTAPPYELMNTGALFLGLEFGGAVVSFALLSIAAGDPAESCGWCSTNGFDTSVRDALRASDPKTAGTVSHVLSIGLAPAAALSSVIVPALVHDRPSYAVADSVIILNSFVFTTGVADFTKKIADRQRPAFHYGVQSQTEAGDEPLEQYLSFFSGDTAWAFSLASSATTLSYLRGYASAPYILAGGAVIGVGTGALRIAADMHWATDVLGGRCRWDGFGHAAPAALSPARVDPDWLSRAAGGDRRAHRPEPGAIGPVSRGRPA